MNSNTWVKCKINDICRIRRGASPRPIQDYISEQGIPWVKISDATSSGSRFIDSTNEYIKEDGKEKSRFIEKGTLILSNSATPGIPKIMGIDACVHDGWLIIDEFKNVTQEFLYYSFIYERDRLLNLSNGSVFRNLKTDIVKNYEINLPGVNEQKAIAKVLSDLDEKIETNNKINKKLEEMAQAIFKQWFVDFEFPNEDGKPYKSSGGEMVESELGMIPKGWNIKKLSELADMKNGVNYGRNQEGEKVKVVNVRDFDGSLVVNDKKLDSVFLLQKQINDYRLQKYDTVIVRSAKPGETLLVNDDNLKVYSGFTIRIRPKDYNIKLYVFYCIRNSIRQLENSSNGTIFKNLNQQLLGKVSVIEPKIEVINKYNDFIKTIIDKIYIVNEEINRLTDLRDTLLPKLMSGEIRVPVEN